MATSIITTDDLREFKMELLVDIKKLLNNQGSGKLKRYLKSAEVMERAKFLSDELYKATQCGI